MFGQLFLGAKFKRKIRVDRSDEIAQQVKDLMQKSNQKLILAVRG